MKIRYYKIKEQDLWMKWSEMALNHVFGERNLMRPELIDFEIFKKRLLEGCITYKGVPVKLV